MATGTPGGASMQASNERLFASSSLLTPASRGASAVSPPPPPPTNVPPPTLAPTPTPPSSTPTETPQPSNQFLFVKIEGSPPKDSSGAIFLNGVMKTENPFAIRDGKNSNTSFYNDSGKLSLICFEKIPRTALKNLPPGGMNFMYVVTRYVNLSTSILSSLGDDLMFYSQSGSGYDGIQSIVSAVEKMDKPPSKDQLLVITPGKEGDDKIKSISEYMGDIPDDDAFRKIKGSKGMMAAIKSIKQDYKSIIFGTEPPRVGVPITKGLITP